ncbi:hypothetical protein, partial [Paraburkholderia sp. BR14264]|uniref:hypothetical protein n=1 Tax=Paraburkholderia sp. BR14264 TaxID=3237001 RepID=UPI00397DCC22
KQTLGERVGAAHDLQWASGGSSINASRTLRDDVFQRYFSNLLVVCRTGNGRIISLKAFFVIQIVNQFVNLFVKPFVNAACMTLVA